MYCICVCYKYCIVYYGEILRYGNRRYEYACGVFGVAKRHFERDKWGAFSAGERLPDLWQQV